MGAEELNKLLNKLRNSNALLMPPGPAAENTVDADRETAQNVTRRHWTLRNILEAIMSTFRRKMSVEELDEHRRKRRNQLATVPLPKPPKVVSEVAPYSPTNVHPLRKPEPVDAEYRTIPEIAPAVTADRWHE